MALNNKIAAMSPAYYPRQTKKLLVLLADIFLLPVSFCMAFFIRVGFWDPRIFVDTTGLVILMVLSTIMLVGFRLYRITLSSFDLSGLAWVGGFCLSLVFLSTTLEFLFEFGLPRSIPTIFGVSFFALAVLVRVIAIKSILFLDKLDDQRVPVAIYGAGSSGVQLASLLKESKEMRPVCFVDDNSKLNGLIIAGLHVQKADALERLVRNKAIRRILVAIPSLDAAERKTLMDRLSKLDCDVQIVPAYSDLISGKRKIEDLRPITLDDLLGRDKISLDSPEIAKTYAGRNVMVTGAGGSIGAELCRQILFCNPAKIVLFERSEHALYQIDRELAALDPDEEIKIVRHLGSVTDRVTLDAVLENEAIDVVLHAAAYKHVPLVEENEVEGARNNVLGTNEIVQAAYRAGIERFIFVSTDKAVRPTNVMGATKRLAELIIQDIQSRSEKTKFSMVRFGNVLGSSGSVVPLFSKQIAQGGPVTVTDKLMVRYLMTIPEAARLVLLAGAGSKGDDLFVLDMGKPVKIIDLAHKMIQLAGMTVKDENNPNGDIEIKVTGRRPGEKLFEELLIENASADKSLHPKIFRAKEKCLSQVEVAAMIRAMRSAVEKRDRQAVRDTIHRYVKEYDQQKAPAAADGA